MCTLSIDFGTSSVKTAILDSKNDIISAVTCNYEYKTAGANEVIIDMGELESAFINSVKSLEQYLGNVERICFDTFAPSLVLMNEEGNALYPIVTHLDRRSRKYTNVILRKIGKQKFLQTTGTLPHCGGVTLTTLLWFIENEKELIKKTHKIGHLTTYLYKRLTGKWAMDRVNASVTGMYETVSGSGWSNYICQTMGVDMNILPPIKNAGQQRDTISSQAAQWLGVKESVEVILGTQDVASALVGAGVQNSGESLCIAGSSEMISVLTDKPVVNEKYYLRATAHEGIWQIFCITTGGFAIDWCRNQMFSDFDKVDFYENYLPELLISNFDTNGVTFLPYISGDRQSLRNKKGGFGGLTLDCTRQNMLCAVVSGIQQQAKAIYYACKSEFEVKNIIKVTGNLITNSGYMLSKQKLFEGAELVQIDNCTIIGNAILAKIYDDIGAK